MEVFGFHHRSDNLIYKDDLTFSETYYDIQNILNVIGWIPFFGMFTGFTRIGGTTTMWLADKESCKRKKYYRVSNARGIVEAFSFGFIFIIPDLVVGIKRRKKLNKINKL